MTWRQAGRLLGTARKQATMHLCQKMMQQKETGYNAPLSKDDAAETVAYTLILFPQVFSNSLPITATITGGQSFNATLNFTEANVDAGDTDAKNEWVAGRQYNLSVTLHKTGITVNGSAIQGWDEADGGNVNAD